MSNKQSKAKNHNFLTMMSVCSSIRMKHSNSDEFTIIFTFAIGNNMVSEVELHGELFETTSMDEIYSLCRARIIADLQLYEDEKSFYDGILTLEQRDEILEALMVEEG